MLVVRNIFVAKPGNASKLASRPGGRQPPQRPSFPYRVLTDLTGDFNRVILEFEVESAAAFEANMKEYATNPAFPGKMKGYADLYISREPRTPSDRLIARFLVAELDKRIASGNKKRLPCIPTEPSFFLDVFAAPMRPGRCFPAAAALLDWVGAVVSLWSAVSHMAPAAIGTDHLECCSRRIRVARCGRIVSRFRRYFDVGGKHHRVRRVAALGPEIFDRLK